MRRQLILSLLVLLSACAPTIANRGNLVDPDKLAVIKQGTSTREDVIDKLGSPSHRSAFNDATWYYIGRRTKQYSFLDPKVTDQEIVTINFNEAGVVTTINKTGADAVADITPAPGATPSFGRETTWLQDLFGNVGRAGLPMGRGQR
ncbi:MAG: outer membrane protein assembly factor BamE [Alphaproteobacteria bacterium]